ncbi:alcohol dehydrogenase IV [Cristinia sonorae]|uniref:Alcohol dehydrogenase IV n=1 Tax=Cristinia sonorae TaxID=1940300 RepID=A0A8K0XKH0_9AGAR|nr:alcohol dehydrogenase IV [Cristinia sonorae]
MSAMDITKYPSTDLHGYYAYTDTLKGVYYGPGSVETALPKLMNTLGVKKALIVTGRTLAFKTDVVKKVEGILKKLDAHGGTFTDIGQHTPVAGIYEGLKQFKEVQADFIVSVGGGSPIDASKAILYFLQLETGGRTLPQIAIPTTLSAAEYSNGAGFTNEEGIKTAVSSPELPPAGIILDAELTLATPERLWLSTGLRALDHAAESLTRPLIPVPLKYLFYASLADLFKYLLQSKADPSNIVIRQKLQIASWMSIWPIGFEKYSALGLSHALGHKLGAAYGIPHGITSCLTLAPTIRLKAYISPEEDKEWLANALFYLRRPTTGSKEGDIVDFANAINQLVLDLGLKSTLSEYKVPKEDLPKVAEQAIGTRDHPAFGKVVDLLESLYE